MTPHAPRRWRRAPTAAPATAAPAAPYAGPVINGRPAIIAATVVVGAAMIAAIIGAAPPAGGRRCRRRVREPRHPHRGRAPRCPPSARDRPHRHRRRDRPPKRTRRAPTRRPTAHRERGSSTVSSPASFLLARRRRGRDRLQLHLRSLPRRLKGEVGVGRVDIEVPIGELRDEIGSRRAASGRSRSAAAARIARFSTATAQARCQVAGRRTGDHTELHRSSQC